MRGKVAKLWEFNFTRNPDFLWGLPPVFQVLLCTVALNFPASYFENVYINIALTVLRFVVFFICVDWGIYSAWKTGELNRDSFNGKTLTFATFGATVLFAVQVYLVCV